MLNKNKERELVYVVYIDDIKPIAGKDRVECAVVGGWNVMVRKGDFNIGDPAIYFEIDSLVPKTEAFAFLESKNYRIKTQKYGDFYSQGLLMPAKDFGWVVETDSGELMYIKDNNETKHYANDESRFLTKQLNVIYYDPIDNIRKSNRQTQEFSPLFKKIKKHFPFKQLLKTETGRKILLSIFGLKKKKREWPWFVHKTDEERIQNMPWILNDKDLYEVTEKIDGCSSTYAVEKKFGKLKFYVCSRNIVLQRSSKCYYDDNVWFEMYDKYHIEDFLRDYIKKTNASWVYLQGETFGGGVQKRDYSIKDHDFRAFILCTSNHSRYTYKETKEILEKYSIPTVPIVNEKYNLPDTVEELLKEAAGKSEIDGLPREGIVLRKVDDPNISFKAVDNAFLDKYHK